jgi:hypothetical protein
MNVKAITFRPVRGGSQEGIPTVWVELAVGSSPMPPSEVIETIIGFNAGKAKNVAIVGDLAYEDSDLMYALVRALKDFGYAIRIETNGQIYPPWFERATWIVVGLETADGWLRHPCHEIRYRIDSGGDPEPQFPASVPASYIICKDLKEAVSFVRRAKNPWGIILDQGPKFVEIIYQAVADSELKLKLTKGET